MVGVWLAIVLLITSAVLPLDAEVVATRDLRVTDAGGQATVAPAENPKAPVLLDEDTPLEENDVVVTGPNSRAELTMDGETVFKLQPDSRLKVLKIFPTNTQLELSQGGLLAKVKPAAREEEAIILKMPTAVVAIRGTEFGAETGDGVSHIGVFNEGHVAVAGAWGHEHVLLEPNQETHVPLSNVPAPPLKLQRFASRRAQMANVRVRHAYWRQHWQAMGPGERARIRKRINSPVRFASKGFRRPAVRPVAKKHPAFHRAAKKAVHRPATHRPATHRATAHHQTRKKIRHRQRSQP
jgi:hypothetical protein